MNPIEALMNNDPAGFRDSVNDMLMQKLSDRLDLERINTAQGLFGEPDDEAEAENPDNDEDLSFEDDEEGFYDDEDQADFFSDEEE